MQFKTGKERYIFEARDIIEVIPYANLKPIPKAPPYVAGLLNYRGHTVPVVDVCYLMSDKLCEPKLSTRIALVNYKGVNYKNEHNATVCIGLLIEQLTETVRFDEADFSDSGVVLKDDPYLGKVVIDDHGIIQLVNIKKIIPAEAQDMLFDSVI
ncbi:MAG: chemotaxis protein CheW [Gallionellaceae bacterium]|nr:chemotaxis protein CheW [Gallionellaceae bacterium]